MICQHIDERTQDCTNALSKPEVKKLWGKLNGGRRGGKVSSCSFSLLFGEQCWLMWENLKLCPPPQMSYKALLPQHLFVPSCCFPCPVLSDVLPGTHHIWPLEGRKVTWAVTDPEHQQNRKRRFNWDFTVCVLVCFRYQENKTNLLWNRS